MTRHFLRCVVSVDMTLRDALAAVDASGLEIALAVDSGNRLQGVLTDGDVRRALLGGAELDAPLRQYMKPNFVFVTPQAGRAEVMDLMQARVISQIPVLDEEGRLVGLHTLHELLGAEERPNWAVIMAGGRGERLRPLTDAVPKPMLKVAGRPIIERIVLNLVGHGIRQIFISVNYRGEMIERHFGDGSGLGCRITYLREERPLGTGGALSLLQEPPRHPVLVVNGDLLSQFDVGRMLALHQQGPFVATVGVHEYTHTVPLGVVDVEGSRVIAIREKPTHSWIANAGIYVLDPSLLPRVPRETHFPLPALIEECLESGEPVGAFLIEDEWTDVGRPRELLRARGVTDKS